MVGSVWVWVHSGVMFRNELSKRGIWVIPWSDTSELITEMDQSSKLPARYGSAGFATKNTGGSRLIWNCYNKEFSFELAVFWAHEHCRDRSAISVWIRIIWEFGLSLQTVFEKWKCSFFPIKDLHCWQEVYKPAGNLWTAFLWAF